MALSGRPIGDLLHRRSRGSRSTSRPAEPNDQPVPVLAGVFVDTAKLASLTDDYLHLKHRLFPDLNYRSTRRLDRILPEIKGAKLRKHATRGNARQKRRAIAFLDHVMGLIRRHDVRVVARISIKAPGSPFKATAVYTSSIQALCRYFEHYLMERDSGGLCIADSRSKSKNLRVSHSIFTQKFSATPNYERLVELPTSDTATITPASRSATSCARDFCIRSRATPTARDT